jgi:hypothetical protein
LDVKKILKSLKHILLYAKPELREKRREEKKER